MIENSYEGIELAEMSPAAKKIWKNLKYFKNQISIRNNNFVMDECNLEAKEIPEVIKMRNPKISTLKKKDRILIAMGIPTTSKRCKTIEEYSLLINFLPSFLNSIEDKFDFVLYVGFDEDDPFYVNRTEIQDAFSNLTANYENVQTRFIDCPNLGIISFYWNYLFHIAISEGSDYFYQVNDDLKFFSKGWASDFIDTLRSMDDVGVVGPNDILLHCILLTQSFVSRKHFELFGWYYPPELHNWFTDSWITNVYKDNTKCLIKHSIRNLADKGTRYKACKETDWWKLVLFHRSRLLKE